VSLLVSVSQRVISVDPKPAIRVATDKLDAFRAALEKLGRRPLPSASGART
jgi:hypothetical protein